MNEQRAERPAFGALLRRHRIDAGLSQEMLAERARISVQAVSALERGARNAPRADTLALLVETLGLEGEARSVFEQVARAAIRPRIRTEQPLGRRADPAVPDAAIPAATPPHFATQFIGRLGELNELRDIVRPGACTTLWGTGGIGKTRLAAQFANASPGEGLATIAFVPLAPAIGDDAVAAAVAAALGISASLGQDLLARIDDALGEKNGLLVLDNCEHVISGAARLVERLLRSAPHVAIICTSREPLRIGGERVFRVKTLDLVDSVRLFLDRAGSASAARTPSPAERRSIETICRRLDGLPLSLELAAACTRAIDVANIERSLDERFDLLARGSRAVDARHLTLHATIAWSYDLLEPLERIVFERIAIVNGRFTFDDALAVATGDRVDRGPAIAALSALVDKALVTLEAIPGASQRSYRLLESTRAFAAQIAPERAADPDIDVTKRRLGAYLLERAIRAREASRRGDDSPIRSFDVDVLRGYLQWALAEYHDVERGTTLAGRLMTFWDLHGSQDEGLRWIGMGLERIVPGAGDTVAECVAYIGTSRLRQRLSKYAESIAPAARAYELATEMGDTEYRAAAAYLLAFGYAVLGKYEQAFENVQDALAAYAELGDDLGLVHLRDVAALAAFRSGRVDMGRIIYAEAIEGHWKAGRLRTSACMEIDLAEEEFAIGNAGIAIDRARSGIETLRTEGTPHLVALGLANESAYLVDVDRSDEAVARTREGLSIARDGKYEQSALLFMHTIAAIGAQRRASVERSAQLAGYVKTAMRRSFPELGFTESRMRYRLESAIANSLSPEHVAAAEARGTSLNEDAAAALAFAILDESEREGRASSDSSGVA